MDLTVVAYTASAFGTLLALSTVAFLGTWEIQAQTVPPFLADQGYTPRIFVNRVADAVHRIRRETSSRIETEIIVGSQVTPVGELASYFGVYELIKASQHSLGIGPPRIEIEVLQGSESASWLLRGPHAVHGWTIQTGDAPMERPDALIDEIAFATLGYIAPFEALAYDLVQDSWVGDYDKTIARASGLLSACEAAAEQRWTIADWVVPTWLSGRNRDTSADWEASNSVTAGGCTEDSIRLGLVLRGLANLNAQSFGQAFDDLRAANTMGAPNALATAFLGDALLELGNGDAAQTRYDEARDIDPAIAGRFHGFGRGLAEGGNHLLANRRYATAARLGAEGAAFLADWGDALFAVGEFGAALAKYQQAEARNKETEVYADRIEKAQKAFAEKEDEKSPPATDEGSGGAGGTASPSTAVSPDKN